MLPGPVHINSEEASCLLITRSESEVRFVPKSADALSIHALPADQFDKEWKPKEYDIEVAVSHYLKHADKTNTAQDVVDAIASLLSDGSGVAEKVTTVDPTPATPETFAAPESMIPAPTVDQPVEATPSVVPTPTPANQSKEKQVMSADQNPQGAYQVQVTDKGVLIEMQKTPETKLATADFQDKPLTVAPAGAPFFYVALNENGVMERCVANSLADRKTIAALVGNWVAEGYLVERCSTKVLMKHLRVIDKADKVKEGEPAGEPAAADPTSAG
jgi:hypothetical protein